MLYDRAEIEVQAGAGGDGCVSFRREAHVPKGGPDGGDGGRGGDIIIVCDDSLRDLHRFKRRPHRQAGRGGHGEGALRHGADGEDLLLAVPPGTEVVGAGDDLASRRWDFVEAGQRAVIAKGGMGGHGNKRFATPTRQAPRFAERGLAGQQGKLALQLKLLADVGLIGLPNAGKSSLIGRLTRAAPKVASYPFTTLEPALGVLEEDDRQLVIADIPGLIEGASDGAGLGHDFLSHVERCRLLVHVLDLAPELSQGEGADPVVNHETIERELAAYQARLAQLPRVLALSKADLLPPERVTEQVNAWSRRLGGDVPVIATSSATGIGLRELASTLLRLVPEGQGQREQAAAQGQDQEELAEYMVFRPGRRSGFHVRRTDTHRFVVEGEGIAKLLQRFDVDNEEAMTYLEGRLRRIGVIAALEAEGFQPGDEIEIAGMVLELDPDVGA